jgi:hypothetical protein
MNNNININNNIKHNILNLLSDIDKTEIIINERNHNNNILIQKYKNELNIVITNFFIINKKLFN